MFKDYKGIFKSLRDMQDQLWKDSLANFPGAALPVDMDDWHKKTLENVNVWAGQAVRQSLQLQREWLEQWAERVGSRKLKPKLFAELSEEARSSTERWLENQNMLWNQWLEVLKGSGGPAHQLDYADWEKAVHDSMEKQMSLLNEWSEMAKFKKLSTKELAKLSDQIQKSMQKSIETQQQLWGQWFTGLGGEKAEAEEAKPVAAKAKKRQPKTAAKSKKPAAKSARSGDDLKQISGIGPGLEKKLKDNGISTLKQLAGLSDKDVEKLESEIVRFSGRIKREKWVEQARQLTT